MKSEIASVRHKERSLDDKRREALNKILDIKGCIRVFSRVRPFLPTDKQRTHQPISVESGEDCRWQRNREVPVPVPDSTGSIRYCTGPGGVTGRKPGFTGPSRSAVESSWATGFGPH
ncbi:hypothetical protein KY285_002446 [Solanum tuberosum]|nr:hypothetical protein KY285_002446 [Solanum tuberosum]